MASTFISASNGRKKPAHSKNPMYSKKQYLCRKNKTAMENNPYVGEPGLNNLIGVSLLPLTQQAEKPGGDVNVDDEAHDVVGDLNKGAGGKRGVNLEFLKRQRHYGA